MRDRGRAGWAGMNDKGGRMGEKDKDKDKGIEDTLANIWVKAVNTNIANTLSNPPSKHKSSIRMRRGVMRPSSIDTSEYSRGPPSLIDINNSTILRGGSADGMGAESSRGDVHSRLARMVERRGSRRVREGSGGRKDINRLILPGIATMSKIEMDEESEEGCGSEHGSRVEGRKGQNRLLTMKRKSKYEEAVTRPSPTPVNRSSLTPHHRPLLPPLPSIPTLPPPVDTPSPTHPLAQSISTVESRQGGFFLLRAKHKARMQDYNDYYVEERGGGENKGVSIGVITPHRPPTNSTINIDPSTPNRIITDIAEMPEESSSSVYTDRYTEERVGGVIPSVLTNGSINALQSRVNANIEPAFAQMAFDNMLRMVDIGVIRMG